ncbi:Repetin [Streptomyces enissocaesilis]|uniref:Repetin n=1 Tax=Streptomyces enissocaesilis TaxID=332589 RepID=A0ABP6JA35_9ACTN
MLRHDVRGAGRRKSAGRPDNSRTTRPRSCHEPFDPPPAKIAAFGAAPLVTAGAAGTALASGDEVARGEEREAAAPAGAAKPHRPAGDDITFTFHARSAAEDTMGPEKAYGTFRFEHVFPDGASGRARGKVDCLVTGGKAAAVTGVITGTDRPDKGERVGIPVHDRGRTDRPGHSWIGRDAEKQEPPMCVSSAPFEKTRAGSGGFKPLPWQPRYEQAPAKG